MKKFADLHIHTYYSDGTFSPQEVVTDALKMHLDCVSITDHDIVDGIAETQTFAKSLGLEVVPGIEMSSEMEGADIHVLGYFFDTQDTTLTNVLSQMQNGRVQRMVMMIEKLKGQGINNITLEEVIGVTKTKAVGRPHLAAVLKDKKWVSTIKEAFDQYIGEGGPAYVGKFKQTPYEAIQLIRKAGGVAVMAHPMVTAKDELIPRMVEAGLQGLEVYYPNYSSSIIQYYEGLAQKYGLVTTGGSDAHGTRKPNSYIGKVKLPYEHVLALKALQGR